MKFKKTIFLSDTFRKKHPQIKILLQIVSRAFAICFKWNKRVSIIDFQVNHSFLLSNGFIKISWHLKNCLWVKINDNLTTNKKGIILHFNRLETPINIEIIGLFNKIQKQVLIKPTATIQSQNLQKPILDNMRFKFGERNATISINSHFFVIPSNSKSLSTKIKPIQINLPVFNTDHNYE